MQPECHQIYTKFTVRMRIAMETELESNYSCTNKNEKNYYINIFKRAAI